MITITDGLVKAERNDRLVKLFVQDEQFMQCGIDTAKVLLTNLEPSMKNRGHFLRQVGDRWLRSYDVKSTVRVLRKIINS